MGGYPPLGQVGVRQTTDIDALLATRDIILGLGLTPQTYSTVQVEEGDLAVAVHDPSTFMPGQLLSFYDETGEEDLPVSSDWDGSNPVTINWSGLDYPGFQYDHLVNTPVGTNLFAFVPDDIDVMLSGPDPLIYVAVLAEKDVPVAGHQVAPVYSMHIDYRRALTQPKTTGPGGPVLMNTNVWSMRQQKKCREDMRTLSKAIRDNVNMTTSSGDHAVSLTDPTNLGREIFTIQWNKVLLDQNVQHFVAQADFMIQAFWEVFGVT